MKEKSNWRTLKNQDKGKAKTQITESHPEIKFLNQVIHAWRLHCLSSLQDDSSSFHSGLSLTSSLSAKKRFLACHKRTSAATWLRFLALLHFFDGSSSRILKGSKPTLWTGFLTCLPRAEARMLTITPPRPPWQLGFLDVI